MVGILVLLIFGFGGLTRFVSSVMPTGNKDNWKEGLREQNKNYSAMMSQQGNSMISRDSFEQLIKVNEYRIEHDMPPEQGTMWGFVIDGASLVSIISLFTIIIGAGMVAGEFSEGTVKLLLIRPSKRWKILLSKYLSTLLSTLFMLLILFIVSFMVGGIFFGFTGALQPHLSYSNGSVHEVSMAGYVFSLYGYNCVNLIMMATFAFMLSTVFRNNALAIGLSIFLMFTGNTLVTFLARYDWVKYILFANTNLRMYSDGTPLAPGMTLGFSIAVLLVYYIVFNAISWFGFSRRDVMA